MASLLQLASSVTFAVTLIFLPRILGHTVLDAWNLPPIEIAALQSLYDATDGLNWAWTVESVRWNFTGSPNPCLESWYGVHCTTVPVNDFVNVHDISLESWGLTGTLPVEVGNWAELTVLDLYDNSLTGTLPLEIGNLTHLQYLYLDCNHLTGNLPPELGNLTQLLDLYLNNNHLTGSLPLELGKLTQLVVLNLVTNHLTGTLPPELGNLTQLLYLYLNTNHLSGTLPPELGSLATLRRLYLQVNDLTGTLPPELGTAAQLQNLYLEQNQLTGTLSAKLGALIRLLDLDLDTNLLTGTLPPELGNLTQLHYLNLGTNSFTSTLPIELSSLTQLQYFHLDTNHLTGTLPADLGKLTQLDELYLHTNHFAGTLPPEIGNLAQILTLDMHSNRLTGTLPPELGDLVTIKYLDMSSNGFTGAILPDVVSGPTLGYFSVAGNHLRGCLPVVGGIKTLQEIDVSHNQLRCSLDGVFDGADGNSAMLNLQLENNQFTGTLPAVLFSLPKLQTLVAASNCFTGTLPQEICQATALQSLILDGVGASSSCPTAWTTWQREGQLRIPNRFHGTIPKCVFGLPALTSIHLSGNNLVGSIPVGVNLGGNLTELYLSHNLLTGSIPGAVQTHAWSLLDLSYNRFSGSLLPSFGEGTLQGAFNATASVVVNNSRLSGEIPGTVLQLPQVSMLGSNMFSCEADKSDVPNTDGNDDKERYQCGSDSFNYSFYLFLVLVGVAFLLLIYLRMSSKLFSIVHQWRLPGSGIPASCQSVFAMIRVLSQLAVYCCVPLLLVLVPWYSAASHSYGTYTHQYAWVVSAAFLSGLAPGLVDFFLWAVLVLCAVRFAYILVQKIDDSSFQPGTRSEDVQDISVESGHGTSISFAARAQAYMVYLGINLVVVMGVNVAFVYISLRESSKVVLVAQAALSLFKFGWNTVCVPYLIRLVSRTIMPAENSSGFFRVQVFIGLFNNIAIPCLVVAAESPSCFYDVLFPPASVTSSYSIPSCQLVGNVGLDCTAQSSVPGESSFKPQFRYSYQCSSSFVTYYSAAMVYFALTAAVLVPAVRLLLCWVVKCTSAESKIHQWSNAALPKLWRMPNEAAAQSDRTSSAGKFFNANNLLVSMTIYLGILLSFGVVFPPVALAMCVAMLSTACQTRLAVGRLLCNAREVGALHVVEAVERDCRGAASLEKLQSMIVMAFVFACYFYALFIFDTIGDAEGFAGACWVLALWVVVPLCSAAYSRYRGYGKHLGGSKEVQGRDSSVVRSSADLMELAAVGLSAGRAAKPGIEKAEEGRGQAEGDGDSDGVTVSALHA